MRKNVVLILIMLIIFVNLICEDFFVYGPFTNLRRYDPETVDGRSEALGRCSILSSSGANYVFNNAAMLSILSQKTIQISERIICGKDEFKSNDGVADYEYPINLRINGISFGMPLNIPNTKDLRFGLGFGYRAYYDLSEEIHIEDNIYDSDYTFINKGGFSNIVIGGGISFHDNFLFGLSTSFPFLSNFSTEYNNSNGDKSITKGSMKSTFFTLSASYIYSKKITLGARLRTSFTLKWKNDSEDENVNLKVPLEFGLTLAISPNSSVEVYIECLTRNLSHYKIESDSNIYHPYENLNNGYSIRTGFEIGKNTILRGGIFLQSLPIYEIKDAMGDETEYDKTPKAEIGFTTGLGFKMKSKVTLDMYGTYSFVKFDQSYDSWYSGQNSNEIFLSQIKLGCSIGYEF